jgi:outer membrane protein assembly factor BamE (lipoprotein component of BamABCDE complex)
MNKLLIAFLCLILSGCVTNTGNQFLAKTSKSDLSEKLIRNKTTQEEVLDLFGDPLKTDFLLDGTEVWSYEYKKVEEKYINFVPYASLLYNGTNDTTKKLKIKFNKQNTIENYNFTSSNGETKRGSTVILSRL